MYVSSMQVFVYDVGEVLITLDCREALTHAYDFSLLCKVDHAEKNKYANSNQTCLCEHGERHEQDITDLLWHDW